MSTNYRKRKTRGRVFRLQNLENRNRKTGGRVFSKIYKMQNTRLF